MGGRRALAGWILALTALLSGVEGFTISQFEVPSHATRYTNVTLFCDVDAGKYQLYYIKWSLNDRVFYRYILNEDTDEMEMQNMNHPDLDVMMEESAGGRVALREVGVAASGHYKCEINSVWPDFLSDKRNASLTVVVLPEEQPNIEGEVADRYAVGEHVNLNCTAAPSIPPAALVWIINNHTAPEEYTITYPPEQQPDGLLVSRLGLSFTLAQHHFSNLELKLKCTATIATLYHRSDEHSQQDPKTTLPVVVPSLPQGGGHATPQEATSATISLRPCLPLLPLPLLLVLLLPALPTHRR